MTRLERAQLAKTLGYTYNPITGEIISPKGKIIKGESRGYIHFQVKKYGLYGHHYAWYMTYDNIDIVEIDHINRMRNDNRISNLRNVSIEQNKFNKETKGYTYHKQLDKWMARIQVYKDIIYLGVYDTEQEAREVYLQAKKKYHII
jgi:hypothetical protein